MGVVDHVHIGRRPRAPPQPLAPAPAFLSAHMAVRIHFHRKKPFRTCSRRPGMDDNRAAECELQQWIAGTWVG